MAGAMLEVRSLAEEQMDAVALDPNTYAQVLRDLARVNTITMARRPTLSFLKAIARALSKTGGRRDLRILDVGFGDGDMLRAIARALPEAQLTGIDLNPKSAGIARAATPPGVEIDWQTGDYASLAGQDWDVILSSLVVHHMTHDQLIAFLRFMDKEARCGWLINDLHRHGFAYRGYPLLARIMGTHRIVREDGTLSIARSYRPKEWTPILAEAGVTGMRVFRAFPFRLCVSSIS
jgi:2-polyprenyl-3-methyl-5-hydroxy-6-metoxy-1,4-benzoquinol methylase